MSPETAGAEGSGPGVDRERLAAAVEALLFSHGAPVPGERLAEVLETD